MGRVAVVAMLLALAGCNEPDLQIDPQIRRERMVDRCIATQVMNPIDCANAAEIAIPRRPRP